MTDHLSGATTARQTTAGEEIARLQEANSELLAANAALEQQVRPCSWPGHSVLFQLNFSIFEVSSGDNLVHSRAT
jgi:hypothetical protein